MDVPGVAEPTVGVTEDPPSLSVFVIVRVAREVKVSESVAVTVEASEALAEAVFTYVAPVAPEGTVPASCRVTDCPAGSEARLQESLAAVKVTPEGRFGLEMLEKPWAGRVSTTLRLAASEGPVFETTSV